MFLLRIMPLLDVLSTAVMLFLHHGMLTGKLAFPFAAYLILKGFAFRDFASIMDMLIGFYVLAMIFFGIHTFLVYLFAVYLIQKAVLSFF